MYPLSNATENLKKALEIASKTAAMANTTFVGSEHFIYAFLCLPDCTAYSVLASEGVVREEYGKLFSMRVDKDFQGKGLTMRMKNMYNAAVEGSKKMGLLAGTSHMLFEILSTPNCQGVSFLRQFADIETLRRKTWTMICSLKNRERLARDHEEQTTSS